MLDYERECSGQFFTCTGRVSVPSLNAYFVRWSHATYEGKQCEIPNKRSDIPIYKKLTQLSLFTNHFKLFRDFRSFIWLKQSEN